MTVGDLPKFRSNFAQFVIAHAGMITTTFIGTKQYSKDLEQGQLEVTAKIKALVNVIKAIFVYDIFGLYLFIYLFIYIYLYIYIYIYTYINMLFF